MTAMGEGINGVRHQDHQDIKLRRFLGCLELTVSDTN